MPISQKDKEFMEQVAVYFCSTKTPVEPKGSINDTANRFKINRNKVRKILITTGDLQSPITEEAVKMRRAGMSIKEIARDLGVSVATVSTALPYEDKVDNTLDPTDHASDVREYRAYEKVRLKRQAGRESGNRGSSAAGIGEEMADRNVNEKEWQKDIKMSYTEAYHRPHRNTWADMEEMREGLEAELKTDNPDDFSELMAAMASVQKRHDAEEKELKTLLSKKKPTDEEKERIKALRVKSGNFPGALNARNRSALEKIAGNRLPPEPVQVRRLHLELYSEYPDEEVTETLRKYGKLEYGDSISRDIVVPSDLPLYALHYVIQRAFGWENSHLRQFELPEERFIKLTNGNAAMWSCMVGILFRSPLMDEDEEFWADDYNGGSFKNWLRKKYTGPYMSQCRGEGLISCQEDMMRLDMNKKYYVMYAKAYNHESGKYDGEEYVGDVSPVYDHKGNKRPEPKPWHSDEVPYRVKIVDFEAIPSEGLKFVFERNPMAVLERLPIDSVLTAGEYRLPEDCSDEERGYIDEQMATFGTEVYERLERYVRRIINEQIDSPLVQVQPMPVTDVLYYNYDFGDNWKIRITASENCRDLVEAGRITQAELDRANIKCREVYRPVLIARDGEMLVDDVGGLHGFAVFLKTINPELKGMDPEEKEAARAEKKESLIWVKSLGWHRDNSTDFNLL